MYSSNESGYRQGYPDMYGNLAHTTVRNTQGILGNVQPQYDTRIQPYQAQPETSQTWDLSHANASQQIQSIIHEAIESAEGWWFRLAPVVTVTAGLETWESTRTRFTAWDPAAEATAPRLVQIEREQHAVRLERFALGLEVHHDNYLTQKGQEEFNLKMGMIEQGLIVLQKLCVLSAVTQSKLYWREQERILQTHYTLADALHMQKARFGAMSKDPLALNKYIAEMPQMLKGAVSKPEFDMCVVPEGCIAHYLYGTQGAYHTDASKRGDNAVERNLTFGMQVIRNVVPGLDVYEDKTFQLTNAETSELNGFRRRAILGQYSVLQYDDTGRESYCGTPGQPTIEMVTMPQDNWTPFFMKECIENCARFDEEGSIMAFTDGAIKNQKMKKTTESIDPWVIPYEGEGGHVEYVPVEFIGEQDIQYRPLAFDLEFGLCAKNHLALTEEENHVLSDLLACADFLYHPGSLAPDYVATAAGDWIEGGALNLIVKTDGDKWGGYTIKNDKLKKSNVETRALEDALAVAVDALAQDDGQDGGKTRDLKQAVTDAEKKLYDLTPTPWGWGDIFMVMSLLSQNKTVGQQYDRILDYQKCKNVLMKIWTMVKEMFPSLVTNDSSMVSYHRKTGDDDRDAMIATLRGLFERIKHPLFRRGANLDAREGVPNDFLQTLNQLNGLGVAGSPLMGKTIEADSFDDGVFATTFDEFASMNETFKQFLPKKEEKKTLREFLKKKYDDAAGATDAAPKRTAAAEFIALFNGIATLLRTAKRAEEDFRTSKIILDDKTILKLESSAKTYLKKIDGGFDEGQVQSSPTYNVTRLTFAPEVYTTAFVRQGNSPTNPTFPSQALFGQSTENPNLVDVNANNDKKLKQFARAKFTTQKFSDPNSVRVGVSGDTILEASSTYGTEKVQYMGASRAMQVGGPFLRILPLKGDEDNEGTAIVEREFMSIRQQKIASVHSHDPIARLFSFAFNLCRVTRDGMLALVDHQMPVPMNFLIAAAYINIDTEAILFAKGGRETASTGMNLLDINKTFDGSHKIWNVHASVHTGTKVVSPENLLIIENAKLAGYKFGLEKTFITDANGATDDGREKPGNYGRYYVMDVPVTYTRHTMEENPQSHPINLFNGHPDEMMYPFQFSDPQSVFRPKEMPFPSYHAYATYFGFYEANRDKYYSDSTYRSLRESDMNPGACWPTRVRCYNTKSGEFELRNQGHGELDDIPLPMRPTLDGRVSYKNYHY